MKAKFECRKQALANMDSSRPYTQKLLYSSMFCGDIFADTALEEAKNLAAKRNETLPALLGYRKPVENRKRKITERGSAHVPDKRSPHQSGSNYKKQNTSWGTKASTEPRPSSSSHSSLPPPQTKQQKKDSRPNQRTHQSGKNSGKGKKRV